MKFSFIGKCVLVLSHSDGDTKSKHVRTDINIDVSENLNKAMYLDKEDLPTKEGSRALTNVFIQGLVANIHQADQKGYRDSAEHLRYIIAELEKGFASVAEVSKGNFNDQ